MHEFPSPDVWLPHRVSYGETDAMGFVYNAEYLHYFERSRSEYIRSRGMSYAEFEKRGCLLPVREAYCRYRHPAHYDELLYIRAGISEWKKASLTFVYEIYNEDKSTIITEGRTEHACIDRSGRPVRMPEWMLNLFR